MFCIKLKILIDSKIVIFLSTRVYSKIIICVVYASACNESLNFQEPKNLGNKMYTHMRRITQNIYVGISIASFITYISVH